MFEVRKLFILAFLVFSLLSYGKETNDAVLNFDSDLIEGVKHKPDLFLQNNVQELSLDSVLYLRKDFNDFHAVDHKRRSRHIRHLGYR